MLLMGGRSGREIIAACVDLQMAFPNVASRLRRTIEKLEGLRNGLSGIAWRSTSWGSCRGCCGGRQAGGRSKAGLVHFRFGKPFPRSPIRRNVFVPAAPLHYGGGKSLFR